MIIYCTKQKYFYESTYCKNPEMNAQVGEQLQMDLARMGINYIPDNNLECPRARICA